MTTQIEKLFQVLFSTCPPSGGNDPQTVAAQMEAYARCVDGYDFRDIEAAVNSFLTGSVPGYNPRWAPTAPELGTGIRRCRDNRLSSEARARKPALPAPDIEKTDESRVRVRAKMAEAINGLAQSMRTDDAKAAADEKRKAEFAKRADARFSPDTSRNAMAQRLGFDVGDPDADAGDWGERRAS